MNVTRREPGSGSGRFPHDSPFAGAAGADGGQLDDLRSLRSIDGASGVQLADLPARTAHRSGGAASPRLQQHTSTPSLDGWLPAAAADPSGSGERWTLFGAALWQRHQPHPKLATTAAAQPVDRPRDQRQVAAEGQRQRDQGWLPVDEQTDSPRRRHAAGESPGSPAAVDMAAVPELRTKSSSSLDTLQMQMNGSQPGVERTPSQSVAAAEAAVAAVPLVKRLGGLAAGFVWMGISSALIILNKHLMADDGFHFPMALSGLGMGFSSIAAFLCCRVFRVVEAKRTVTWHFYATKIMPIGLFMAATLHFGNLVYLYLTVSFIQMLKAFTPIVTMVALFAAGLETPAWRLIGAVAAIAFGTAAASYGELNLSWAGIAFMMLSESFEATRLVMTQILLVGLKFHPIEGLMYLAPACVFWLLIGVGLLEFRTMLAEGAFGLIAARPFTYTLAAAMGFGVNALAYIVIQTSSSLTLKVLGTAKNAIVVWIGIVFLGETVTGLQGAGYALSLGGFFVYNYLKMQGTPSMKPSGSYVAVPTVDDEEKGADERRRS